MQKFTLWSFPKRYVIVIMVFIGYVNFYCLHTNIGMAVVDMTSVKNISLEDGSAVLKSQYEWTSIQKAMVISSFAYGRFFGPLGGVLAGKVGGSTLYALAILGAAIVTFCMPFFLYLNFYLFVIGSALAGVSESFAYASISQLWSRWAPPDERAKFVSFSLIGLYGGSTSSFLLSGWILHKWSWAVLFHSCGTVSLIWFLIWYMIVKNDPSEDTYISEEERNYIEGKINHTLKDKKIIYPWRDMVTCVPLWMGCLCKFCIGAGYTFTMMYLPQYIKDTIDINIKSVGYISLIPQFCSAIATVLGGYVFDHIRSNKKLSPSNTHKLFSCLGLFSGTLAFLVAGSWSNFTACMVCLSIFQFFCAFALLSLQILVLDLAPRYAAFMNSCTMFFFTLASISTPIGVGFVVTTHSRLQWSFCFTGYCVLFTIVGILYLKFSSAKLQYWANYSPEKNQDFGGDEKTSTKHS